MLDIRDIAPFLDHDIAFEPKSPRVRDFRQRLNVDMTLPLEIDPIEPDLTGKSLLARQPRNMGLAQLPKAAHVVKARPGRRLA
jgi:hypothetical protein